MSELLPCPHCGAPAYGYEIEAHQHSPALLALCPDLPAEASGSYVIEGQCDCGCGMIGDSQDAVTSRWNRRTQPALEALELSDAEIEQGRQAIFSTSNPFCPCDSKTMRKAVRWAESALLAKMGGKA